MAVGDVVNGISPASTLIDFQPAAGVEVIITAYGNYNSWVYLVDGTNRALGYNTTNTTPFTGININMKMAINNTNYLSLDSTSGQHSFYTGVQTK